MNLKHIVLGAATVTLLAACASSKPAPTAAAPAAPVAQKTAPVDTSANQQQTAAVDPLNDPNSPLAKRSVYFDFDSSSIKETDKPVIEAHSTYLKANPARKVIIQGNTDARGSNEYNLALGQRRSESVKHAMEVLGVKDTQLEAVSLGKTKPKAEGNNDEAYAENRRADIVYDAK